MSRRRTIRTSANSVRPTHTCHPMTVRLQSSAHPLPICDQSSMLDRSITNQMSIHSNPVSIRCQSIPIRCRSCDNSSQSDADPLPTRRQSYANPSPILCQFNANTVLTRSRSIANPMYQSSPNPSKSSAVNQVPIWFQSISIQCQSNANSAPTRCQSSKKIPCTLTRRPILRQSYVNQ